MPEIPAIFDHQLDFDPACEVETFARQAPAKWVVYLMSDADDRPVQLLCVKNLRNSLKRRLGSADPSEGPSKRVAYRDLVRRVRWVRVDSAFEADWLYYEAARLVFPESYRGMVGFRPAWFIHLDPLAQFPRYTKTIDLSTSSGELIGPVEDKHAAARLMHLMEDAFDLCRYHHILVQSPSAHACAYKEMGKCPAPCDGSVSMEHYRHQAALGLQTLIDPDQARSGLAARMQSAAAELRFEEAAKIKARLDQLSQLGKGPFRHVAQLKDFCYLSLQRGMANVKVFLITPGRIEMILGLIDQPRPAELMQVALQQAADRPLSAMDQSGAERIGIVAHHLFSPKQSQGAFLRLDRIDDKAIAKAWRDVQKQSAGDEEVDGEGVMKELQSVQ